MNFKRIKKILAGSLAGTVLVSAAACTPISTKAQWSYKYGDDEKSIGVYIFALYNAYSRAKTYAEKADGYKEDESFLDLTITDDDGNKAKASDWIKEQADIIVRESLYIDDQMSKKNATVDEAAYLETAKQDWELGYMYSQYSQYGYATTPEQEILEPYGISVESYCDLQYVTSAKQSRLFDLIYGADGTNPVSDSDLKKFFDENYTYYSYFTVPLYESVTDDDGNTSNKAYDDKKQKKLTSLADGYVKAINGGKTVESQCSAYLKYTKSDATTEDTLTTNCEKLDKDNLSSSSLGEDVAKEFTDVKQGKAKAITIGKDDSKTIYVIQKLNTKDAESEYLTKDDSTRESVLTSMKGKEYTDYLQEQAKKLDCEVNESVINRYDPDIFWEKPEDETTTTAASEE
ncbi:MAG: hypothetical protein IJV39_05590 [Ruminococcus sp.]|nr:hypothetical protein [Ruminococcus sp.]